MSSILHCSGFVLDGEEAVVLLEPLALSQAAGLDAVRPDGVREVCDEGVARLARAVRGDGLPPGLMRYLYGFKRLAHRTDLIRFYDDRVYFFVYHSFFDACRVCHRQVVADDKDVLAQCRGQPREVAGSIFSKRILNAVHREACDKFFVYF